MSSKSLFFTKSAISPLCTKFDCFNLAVKFSAVLIYLLSSGILFSTTVRAVVVVAKLVILGISFLTSLIFALREALEIKLVILVILLLTSFILALRVVLESK